MAVVWPWPFSILVKVAQSEKVGDNKLFNEVWQVCSFWKSAALLGLDAQARRADAWIAMQITQILNSIFCSDFRCTLSRFD